MKELTKAEEQIMQVIWKLKKGFVKEFIEELPEPKPAYNTVSTIVRILETKGFLDHKAYGKTHEYFPLISKEEYSRYSINNFVSGYFNGSFRSLVSFFTDETNMSVQEIDQLMKQLDELKNKKK
jgi:BlaI family transcriptional regulator, penicillinase repressor